MGNEGVSTKQLVKRIPSLNQVISQKGWSERAGGVCACSAWLENFFANVVKGVISLPSKYHTLHKLANVVSNRKCICYDDKAELMFELSALFPHKVEEVTDLRAVKVEFSRADSLSSLLVPH